MPIYKVVTRENDVGGFAAEVNGEAGYLPYGAPFLVGEVFHQLLVRAKESKLLLLTALVGNGSNFPSTSASTALMASSLGEVERELSGA